MLHDKKIRFFSIFIVLAGVGAMLVLNGQTACDKLPGQQRVPEISKITDRGNPFKWGSVYQTIYVEGKNFDPANCVITFYAERAKNLISSSDMPCDAEIKVAGDYVACKTRVRGSIAVESSSDTILVSTIPPSALSGDVLVSCRGQTSNAVHLDVSIPGKCDDNQDGIIDDKDPICPADQDRDGISDVDEVNKFHTDRYSQDSDSDGVLDQNEDYDGDKMGTVLEMFMGSDPFKAEGEVNEETGINSFLLDYSANHADTCLQPFPLDPNDSSTAVDLLSGTISVLTPIPFGTLNLALDVDRTEACSLTAKFSGESKNLVFPAGQNVSISINGVHFLALADFDLPIPASSLPGEASDGILVPNTAKIQRHIEIDGYFLDSNTIQGSYYESMKNCAKIYLDNGQSADSCAKAIEVSGQATLTLMRSVH
jgi:hypothetical protein